MSSPTLVSVRTRARAAASASPSLSLASKRMKVFTFFAIGFSASLTAGVPEVHALEWKLVVHLCRAGDGSGRRAVAFRVNPLDSDSEFFPAPVRFEEQRHLIAGPVVGLGTKKLDQ